MSSVQKVHANRVLHRLTDLVNCAWRAEVRPMTKVVAESNGDAACIPNAFMVIIMKSAAESVTIYRRLSTFTTDTDVCAAGHRPSYRVIAESPDGHSDDGYGLHIP